MQTLFPQPFYPKISSPNFNENGRFLSKPPVLVMRSTTGFTFSLLSITLFLRTDAPKVATSLFSRPRRTYLVFYAFRWVHRSDLLKKDELIFEKLGAAFYKNVGRNLKLILKYWERIFLERCTVFLWKSGLNFSRSGVLIFSWTTF